MQGMLQKKEGSHRVICPRCGTENITRQTYCGKCGFIFPKNEKDAGKGGKSSFPGSGGNAGNQSSAGGAGAYGGFSGGSSIPGAPKSVPVAPGAAIGVDEPGAEQQGMKLRLAHEKIDAHAEGMMRERGAWQKCPRCEADVKAGSTRCTHCGWKIGKK